MSESMENIALKDFIFAIEIAKEKASELLDTSDPQVVATLANTYALLGATRAIAPSQEELREGLNFIIDALKGDE